MPNAKKARSPASASAERPLPPGEDRGPIRAATAGPLLKLLHVMNADGSISADMRRKFKQVNHLVELFQPVLAEITRGGRRATIVDANCGNAYLAFLLHHFVTVELGSEVAILGVDRSEERVATCRARAQALGARGLEFVVGDTATAKFPDHVDLLVSLHGCDTATDDVLVRAVRSRIPQVHVVPCCQHELRGRLRDGTPLRAFLRDGVVRGEAAALLTDVLRATWLRTMGYRTEIVEFIPLEHTMKNRLLRAKFTRRRDDDAAEELSELLGWIEGRPRLVAASTDLVPWARGKRESPPECCGTGGGSGEPEDGDPGAVPDP